MIALLLALLVAEPTLPIRAWFETPPSRMSEVWTQAHRCGESMLVRGDAALLSCLTRETPDGCQVSAYLLVYSGGVRTSTASAWEFGGAHASVGDHHAYCRIPNPLLCGERP